MTSASESAENRSVIGNVLKGCPRTLGTFITNEIRLPEWMGLNLSL
ncbi:MAG: hypothetical protein ABL860_04005 [Candidatus Nitrotoga sp.]